MHARFIIDCRGRCLALLLTALVAAPAAAAPDPFTVAGVPVDMTADDAQTAQRAALEDGQQRALRQLFERLTLPADYDLLPPVTQDLISRSVRGFEIANERRAPRRYRADLTVQFNPEPVRTALRMAGLSYAETTSPRVLLLPVLVGGAEPALWSELNTWAEVWRRPAQRQGLVDLQVPLGELSDLAMIDAGRALAGDPIGLTEIRRQYRSSEALVAIARVDETGDVARVDIEVVRYGDMPEPVLAERVAGNPGEPIDQVLTTAAQTVRAHLENEWKSRNLLAFDQQNELIAMIGVRGFQEWLTVRQAIESLAQIRRMEIISLSPAEVLVKLHYLGDQMQLTGALAQRSLALASVGGVWTLAVVGGGPVPRATVQPAGIQPVSPTNGGAADGTDGSAGAPVDPPADDLFIE